MFQEQIDPPRKIELVLLVSHNYLFQQFVGALEDVLDPDPLNTINRCLWIFFDEDKRYEEMVNVLNKQLSGASLHQYLLDKRIGSVSRRHDLSITSPIYLPGQQLQNIPNILQLLNIHPDKIINLHRFLILLLLRHRLELGLGILLNHVTTEPIQEFYEVFMRGYHELDVHHGFLVDFNDLEAVLGQFCYVY